MHVSISPVFLFPHRISYGETDAMGIMYYAEYFHIFERARSEYIRARGISYAEIEKRNIFLPVREASCRYRAPARFDELVYTAIGISEWKRASLRFSYQMFNENKNLLLAEAETQHACVGKTGKPQPFPDWFRQIFQDQN